MPDFDRQRERMVDWQIARRGVSDEATLRALRQIPREMFVPEGQRDFAYQDSPLPIGEGQTISQPYVVALMIEAAALGPGDRALEIGAGSGYAAAAMSAIADRVYAIERHPALAAAAAERLNRLGYAKVEVRTGDGSGGWPEQAPFDAILVAAGGPEAPEVLKRQLKVGGRLVMPVGRSAHDQRLVKIVRRGEDAFEEADLGPVSFVPLVGEYGWQADGHTRGRGLSAPKPPPLSQAIAAAAEPLPDIDDPAFAAAFDRFAAARVVLLGEASHGTHEFYAARAAITRRLIERHGFTLVAAEADWPDAASLDRFVRRRPEPEGAEPAFRRFPAWMWRNFEVEAFVHWLRAHNDAAPPERQAGFYGLDLYNLGGSMRAVIDYLDRVDPKAAKMARERYGCLTPWAAKPEAYGRLSRSSGYGRCEAAVVEMLQALNARRMDYAQQDSDGFLDAAANARLVKDAEAYYRAMYRGSEASWNLRDRHMFETLQQLLDAKGPRAKAVAWAHNSHIGDARGTEMGWTRGELTLGQLCREAFGADAALIGFGAHAGLVACADDWDEPMTLKRINPSRPDSYERLAHESGIARFLLDLREDAHPQLRERLSEPRLLRFIGVIYRPETERWSHYMECRLPGQFDAWVWFDETSAVKPLPTPAAPGADETYPFGL